MIRIMQRFYIVQIFVCLIFLSSCSSIAETTDSIQPLDGIAKTMNAEATTETFTLNTVEAATVATSTNVEPTSTSVMPSSTAATTVGSIEPTDTIQKTAITATEAKPTEPPPTAAPSIEAPLIGEAEAKAYILNTNTMKFHYLKNTTRFRFLPILSTEV